MNFIKRMPMSIGGLALGLVSLGNLLGGSIAPVLAMISAVIMILFLIKIFTQPDLVSLELQNTIGASVAPTFAMAMVMLSRYVALWIDYKAGALLFYGGIILHLILLIYFTKNYRKAINSRDVYGSFMIVYGSFGAGAIVAPFFDAYWIGKIVWMVGMIGYLPLLLLVLYKDFRTPETDEAKMPLFCVAAANGGLLLTGYYNSFRGFNTIFIIFMIVLGQLVYFTALNKLRKYLRLRFYPSYSSFTFPFVINATALKMTAEYFEGLGYNMVFLKTLTMVEVAIATILVIYVFIMYMRFLFTGKTARLF